MNELSAAMALEHGWNVAVASFEQNPRQDHLRSLRTFHAAMPASLLQPQQIEAADKWIDEKVTFIVPGLEDEPDLKWALEKCKAAILRNGAKLIIIDPWNELGHIYPREMTLTQYTGFAIKQFKKLAQRYMVCVIVVAHPAKLQKMKDGMYPIPTLYDISDSSHWYNKADLGIVIHRNDDGTTLVRVAKVRYFNLIGVPGDTKLQCQDYRNRFTSVPDDDVAAAGQHQQRWARNQPYRKSTH